jgi:hypothetical protein
VRNLGLRLSVVTSLLLLATPVWSAPVSYGFESGFVNVQAVRSDDNSLVFDETLPISGTTVVWDANGLPTGFGSGTLDDLEIIIPASGPYSLLQNYGAHDSVTVESVTISPGALYSTLVSLPIGPAQYSVTAGPLDVVAYYSATDSTGVNAPVLNVLAPIAGTNTLVGTVSLPTGGLEIHINNALMGTLPGAAFGEIADLHITGDITWVGSVAAAIPEPSTGVLLALGLGLLASRRTRC